MYVVIINVGESRWQVTMQRWSIVNVQSIVTTNEGKDICRYNYAYIHNPAVYLLQICRNRSKLMFES